MTEEFFEAILKQTHPWVITALSIVMLVLALVLLFEKIGIIVGLFKKDKRDKEHNDAIFDLASSVSTLNDRHGEIYVLQQQQAKAVETLSEQVNAINDGIGPRHEKNLSDTIYDINNTVVSCETDIAATNSAVNAVAQKLATVMGMLGGGNN